MADADTLSEEYSKDILPNTIVQLIAATFGIFGNCLVILMYAKYVEDKSDSRYFIPVLAVVDLMGSVSNVTQFHLDNTMHYIYPGVFLCKIMSFLIVFTGGFSAHLILAIALQRYLIICRPFAQQMTHKWCRIAILIIFLFAVVYASPILKFHGIYELRSLNNTGNLSFCHIDDGIDSSNEMITYLGFLLFLSVINIFITCALYIPVMRTIYQRLSPDRRYRTKHFSDSNDNIASKGTQMFGDEKNTTKPTSQSNEELNNVSRMNGSPEQKARKNISVMFLAIIIVYVVSYLASLATRIHNTASIDKRKGYIRNIYYFCLRFNLLNHIANPFIYWFYDLKFRHEVRRFCCCIFLKR